jgi:hypothetical protein
MKTRIKRGKGDYYYPQVKLNWWTGWKTLGYWYQERTITFGTHTEKITIPHVYADDRLRGSFKAHALNVIEDFKKQPYLISPFNSGKDDSQKNKIKVSVTHDVSVFSFDEVKQHEKPKHQPLIDEVRNYIWKK